MSVLGPTSPDGGAQERVEGFIAPEIPGKAYQLPLWRRKPLLIIGLVILGIYVLLAVAGPFFVDDPRVTDPANFYQGPSSDNWFGTDKFGRDVFARAVHAARLDVTIGIVIALSSMVIGSAIGVVSGYFGGWVDEVMMRLTDVVMAFPGFVLALVLVAAIGNSVPNVVIAVSVAYIPYFIRLTRAQVLAERELEYVDGAKLAGNSPLRVAFRHVLPNSMGPSFVQAALVAGWAILTVAGLAFLGVGIRPPTAEWGVMVAEGAPDIITGQWWTALFPGGMIVLAAMAFQFIGDDMGAETL
ncbi:MAG: ABC transporter permease [Acidimicrobiia bacterium]|nr:ABC transporter permease [Acidimicrobiia bacterium]MDH3397755.1 ABC transporter permease [Acidimicrobiia bacterium]